MYEVEYKVEVTEQERDLLFALFKKAGYESKKAVSQNDYYVQAENSPLGGYDLKRYREEGDKVFYTEKIWEDVGGDKVRKEIEREASKEELTSDVAKNKDTIKIQKVRRSFIGSYQGQSIHIDADSIKFDHSPELRYFIEAEILTGDKNEVISSKERIIKFLKESLGRSEIKESPGMFMMAFEKK